MLDKYRLIQIRYISINYQSPPFFPIHLFLFNYVLDNLVSNVAGLYITPLRTPITFQNMAKLDERIGFIGGGNMAYAIGAGLINRGIVKPSQVLTAGPHLENLNKWEELGASITDVNAECIEKSDIIFLCVKPHMLQTCATQIRETLPAAVRTMDKVFVSVLVGIPLSTLDEVCVY